MFKSPYDTTAAVAYDVKSLEREIEIARTEGALVSGLVDGMPNVMAILNDSSIPVFPHPVTIRSRIDNTLYSTVDLRSYRSQIRKISDSKLELPSSGPVPFALMRAQLQQLWNQPNTPDLFNLSTLPHTVFASWVGDLLSRKFELDGEASVAMTITAAFWYACQYQDITEQQDLTERDLVMYARTIERATRIPMQRSMDYLTRYNKTVTTSTQFIDAAKAIVQSIRLQRLNLGSLYTLIGTSWFGSLDVREVAAAALEYPPTYLAMVWASINENTYRRTPIGELVRKLSKNGADREFVKNLGIALAHAKE